MRQGMTKKYNAMFKMECNAKDAHSHGDRNASVPQAFFFVG